MLPPLNDTLVCDSSSLHGFQSDGAYDYARDLEIPDDDLLKWLLRQIRGIIDELLGTYSGPDVVNLVYILVAMALIGLVGYLIWRNRPAFFYAKGKAAKDALAENNIYGIDFEAELDKYRRLNDYNQCVCILYLQTLRWLADNQLIIWKIYKTPTQYKKEFPSPTFTRFTNLFMRVRYGNYHADESFLTLMLELRGEIMKGRQI
ncbi:UNVERIFIED_CONTAM: DUF4129 domain-containing protein [Prevotella sp. 15_C9]